MSLLRNLFLLLVVGSVTASAQATDNLFTWSGRVPAGATFSVRHFNGPIDIRESTTDRVEFRADRPRRADRGELSFEVQNRATGVEICAVYDGRNICDNEGRGWSRNGPPSTGLTVLLPKGVRLSASTGNGDVSVEQASNDVEIRTGNGDVRIRLTAGEVDVSTGNGVLEIEGATGPVRANTGNGRVFVVTSSGPVNARTGNGEIDVRMRAIQGSADMTFSTGNGPVTVALPGSFAGEIDASTGRGEFRSDFEIRIVGRLNPSRVRGTIGTGGTQRLRMSSGNGRLELRKLD
ncbi:MAG: DUF4097 family beta strand repeat-containing protein [Gemmatimonadaceae bacterium]